MTDNKNIEYVTPEGMLISELLDMCFIWEETTQGHDYWSAVYENLRMIEEANK